MSGRFVVASYSRDLGDEIKLFRLYYVPGCHLSESCTIVEAARATSAAPSYFTGVNVGGTSYLMEVYWRITHALR